MPTARSAIRAGLLPILLLLGAVLPARPAHADGCFVWKNERIDITEPEQKAAIVFKEGWEELTLEVRYEGAPEEFGWIVPLPARPVMSPARAELLTRLSQRTQAPRVGRSLAAWHMRATLGAAGEARVTLLERRQVGIYDAAVLEASGGVALRDWLRANAFHAPAHAEAVFEEYARRGWVFVALKIPPAAVDATTGTKLASGTIQPIRFRFPASAPVFPLRISSLNKGPADILVYLLAADQFVHATCRAGQWEERMCGPMRCEEADPDSHFAADGRPTFYISKLRARLKPGQMEDLAFAPYDAVAALTSPDPAARTEAATYLGFRRRVEGVPALVRFVSGRTRDPVEFAPMEPGRSRSPAPESSQDVRSALWALGEIGAPEAVPALLRWADGPPSETTLEAFDSLARMKAREALPLAVELMHRTARPDRYDFVSASLADSAYGLVVGRGDPGCVPRLRDLSLLHGTTPELTAPDEDKVEGPRTADEAGPCIMVARMACGDMEARAFVLRAIRAGSDVTDSDVMLVEAGRGGSENGFPSGLRVGRTLLAEGEATAGFWRPLSAALSGLKPRPDLRDGLLREAAAQPGVPDLGHTLLLGMLSTPGEADRRALDALWQRALRAPAVAHVPVDTGMPREAYAEDYNLPACAVAYAFTRWRDAASLRRLWSACPAADGTLRAEIALGLARCGQAEDLPRLLEYVRRGWGARVASTAFQSRLKARVSDYVILGNGLNIDVDYRARRIHDYFRNLADGGAAVRALVSDSTLPAAIRLDFLAVMGGTVTGRTLALRRLAEEVPAGDPLAQAIATLQGVEEGRARPRPHNK